MKKQETRRKVDKIYAQIRKVALKGKDHRMDYNRLVDQAVEKGDYGYFEMCLSDYYDIDVSKYGSLYDVKNKTWKLVLEKADSSFINNLRSFYKSSGIYQQGQEIRSDASSYVIVSSSGPLLAQDVTLKRDYSSSVTRTRYIPMPATMSQIYIDRRIYATGSSIDIALEDDKIFEIDIYKVIWATFSSPLYTLPTYATQSSPDDLVRIRMRELDSSGVKEGGISSSSAIRIKEIYDPKQRSVFIGKSIGERFEFDPRKIYRADSEVAALLGIEESRLESASDRFEAEVLEIKTIEMTNFESPYELNRISYIRATQSYLDTGTYSSGIPMTHGGDYLIKTSRRGNPGWISPDYSYEEYSYRVSVRIDNLLGTIREVDSVIDNPMYYQIKSRYATYLGLKKTYLEVQKAGATSSITVVYENFSQSEESNLLARYKIAIGYLNS